MKRSLLIPWGFGLWILGQLLFTWKGVETFPFLNFGMFSEPEPKREIWTALQLCQGAKPLDLSAYDAAWLRGQWLYRWRFWVEQKGQDPIERDLQRRFSASLLPWARRRLSNADAETPQQYVIWLRRHLHIEDGQPLCFCRFSGVYDAQGHWHTRERAYFCLE